MESNKIINLLLPKKDLSIQCYYIIEINRVRDEFNQKIQNYDHRIRSLENEISKLKRRIEKDEWEKIEHTEKDHEK
jgi:TolA-binding protein